MKQNWLVAVVVPLGRSLLLALPLALSLAGCKQGLGDRCEVDTDCASGTCSQAVPKICVSKESDDSKIDALLPIDARVDAP